MLVQACYGIPFSTALTRATDRANLRKSSLRSVVATMITLEISAMAISISKDDFVNDAEFVDLGTKGNLIVPTRIVIHYTAGSTLSGAVSTLKSKGLGYNVLIDTDGSLHQTRPLTRSAGHAGRSNWKPAGDLTNSSSLNGDSIGISFVNLGQFGYFASGKWWWGGPGSGPSIEVAPEN